MVLSRLNGRCSMPVGMDATLNGRLGFNLESTCGTDWPACPMHVACYNSKVRSRFCSLMSDKALVYLWGAAFVETASEWGSISMSTVIACGLGRLKIRGSHLSCFFSSFGETSAQHCFSQFLLGLVFAIRPSAIWIFLSSSARYNTVARTDCWLMDRWACATSAVPIQNSAFSQGPDIPVLTPS